MDIFLLKILYYITLVRNRTHKVTNIIPATNLIIFLLLTLLMAKSPSLVLNVDIPKYIPNIMINKGRMKKKLYSHNAANILTLSPTAPT